ncbi:hypothetical protein BDQ12DRAFT_694074 [Crucibulum laeve]|uniref:F-box domain-containing protein n=1 Tax=Crucibulum laeve TaxID=68775 RepID=A0A5C3LH26_9AGAR|nr:hypothetical protein BDQ12DRAFT_694074 [Crucibulum laeve]
MSIATRTTLGLNTSRSTSLPHGHTSNPSTSFSKFILNQDVVDIVFQHFGDIHYSMSNLERWKTRKALALAARVCRPFSYAALDHLWRYLDSWLPLLQLLPSFKQSMYYSYSLCGVVTDDEWAHFDAHARRVRSFSVLWDDVNAKHITPYTFIRLAQLHPAPIFPALRLLRFSDSENLNSRRLKHIAAGCFLLVSPAIKTLMIDKFDDDLTEHNEFFDAFFSSFMRGSTNIQDLTVDGCIPHWRTLASFCNLTKLRFYKRFEQNWLVCLSMDIKSLRSFNNLTSITIEASITDSYSPGDIQTLLHYVPALNSSECLDCLPHLQEIDLVGGVALLVLVLYHIPSNNLKCISILCTERFDRALSPLWDQFFEQLSHCQYLRNIMMLNTMIHGSYTVSDFAGIISQNHLQSLLKLNHLEVLLIKGYIVDNLHEAFITQSASSWSQLQFLALPDSPLVPEVDSSPQQLGVLSHIARNYLNLAVLKLSVNAMDLAIPIPSSYHSSSRLKNLFLSDRKDLRDLTEPQRQLLARYLYRVFPSLEVVSGVQTEFWEEINAMVQAYKADTFSGASIDHHDSITSMST